MPARLILRREVEPNDVVGPLFKRDPKDPSFLFLYYEPFQARGAEVEDTLVIGDTANHVVLAAFAEGRTDLLPFTTNLDDRIQTAGRLGVRLAAAGSVGVRGTIHDYVCREWYLPPPSNALQHELRSAVFAALDRRRFPIPSRPFVHI